MPQHIDDVTRCKKVARRAQRWSRVHWQEALDGDFGAWLFVCLCLCLCLCFGCRGVITTANSQRLERVTSPLYQNVRLWYVPASRIYSFGPIRTIFCRAWSTQRKGHAHLQSWAVGSEESPKKTAPLLTSNDKHNNENNKPENSNTRTRKEGRSRPGYPLSVTRLSGYPLSALTLRLEFQPNSNPQHGPGPPGSRAQMFSPSPISRKQATTTTEKACEQI